MKKKYLVELSEQEREYLHKLISSGTAPARKLNRARILLKALCRWSREGTPRSALTRSTSGRAPAT